MLATDIKKIEELLQLFDITPDQIKIDETDEAVTITVDQSELEAGRLIGRFASTLDSLQLIISLMLNKGDVHRHILLDVAGYRARRLTTLETMVENAKQQVRNIGGACALPPLSATERRQVHFMLQDDAEFTSYSEGYGQDRRLFIAPKTI
ncbi:MAG: R3H domain-containing nucleic acid-binding protein [bacterium]